MAGLKWSIRRAATEFGRSAETITRGLRRQGLDVTPGKTWTTRQIYSSITSDGQEARAREANASAELKEHQLAVEKGELFRRDMVNSIIGKVGVYVRQTLLEMPHALSQRVNPSDPYLAKEALMGWVDDTLAQLRVLVPDLAEQEQHDDNNRNEVDTQDEQDPGDGDGNPGSEDGKHAPKKGRKLQAGRKRSARVVPATSGLPKNL